MGLDEVTHEHVDRAVGVAGDEVRRGRVERHHDPVRARRRRTGSPADPVALFAVAPHADQVGQTPGAATAPAAKRITDADNKTSTVSGRTDMVPCPPHFRTRLDSDAHTPDLAPHNPRVNRTGRGRPVSAPDVGPRHPRRARGRSVGEYSRFGDEDPPRPGYGVVCGIASGAVGGAGLSAAGAGRLGSGRLDVWDVAP